MQGLIWQNAVLIIEFRRYFRPVFIVAKPAQNIDRLAIDAKADGNFYADCFLNMAVEGARVHTVITDAKKEKSTKTLRMSVRAATMLRLISL